MLVGVVREEGGVVGAFEGAGGERAGVSQAGAREVEDGVVTGRGRGHDEGGRVTAAEDKRL